MSIRSRAGKAGEGHVEAALQACRLRKIARVFRIPNDMQAVRVRGQIMAFPKRKSGPDYFGVLSSGRAVALEVKHCQAKRIKRGISAPRFDLGNIEDHQVRDLIEVHQMGGLAYVVIVHSGPGVEPTFYRVPIVVVWGAIARSEKSLRECVLQEYRVACNKLLLEGLE
jgi:penicillin-binding protein-related factor A (putative recombinase)